MNSNVDSHTVSNPDDILSRYRRAKHLELGIFGKTVAFNTTLHPHWIGDSDRFWYQREHRDGHEFRCVDAQHGHNREAFDHQALASALSAASGETLAADHLPLSQLNLEQAPSQLSFTALGQQWQYRADTHRCQPLETLPAHWVLSPDGRQAAFTRDHNLWVKNLSSGEEKALTHDGERFYAYASAEGLSLYGKQGFAPSVEARWSPDSTQLLTVVRDLREVGIAPPLVDHVPADGSLRPTIQQADRRVAFVGDKQIEAWQVLVIDVASGSQRFADYPPTPVMYPPYVGYFSGHRGWWDADSRHAYFIDQARGAKAIHLVKLDTLTGATQVLIRETHERCVTLIPITHVCTLAYPLPDSNELIWFSERSGWAQLYLYDMASGELKNPITEGEWVLRNVLHVDVARRELIIQTAGRVAGRNPYYCDICRVNIDTGELTELLAGDRDYLASDPRSRVGFPGASAVSPSGQYIVTTASRVDEVPVSLLLDREGTAVATLETADVSGLPADSHWPEPVMLKAADGTSDIYGVVFRPSNFDPNKSYPVLDCSYQYASPIGSFSNNSAGSQYYLLPWAYAELGFICVMIFNRGNEGLRDVAFNTYQNPDFLLAPAHTSRCYKNDVIAGIQQLAARHTYMDLSRVGVTEYGSVPSALMGLLVHSDFYQVGVSVRAMADSRMEGSTPGILSGSDGDLLPEFEQRADQLKGKLLLINGMLDWCMPVSMTLRMAEALKQANQRFDMLLLPQLEHGYCHYVTLRCWDYFVEHLLGIDPPPLALLSDDTPHPAP